MQRILFPTDFSENSWNAITYAFAFFKDKPMDFHFFHAGFNATAPGEGGLYIQGVSMPNVMFRGAYLQLEALRERIESTYPNHKHRIHLYFETTFLIDGIRRYIKNHNIDLIVMGTKGASGIKEATLGSHTGAVITRVKCPALVIPEKAVYVHPSNVAFPTDFNALYKEKMLQTLKDFTVFHNSSIKILRVVRKGSSLEEEQIKNRDFLGDSLQGTPHSFHWIESPELEQGLQEFVDALGIDIIAMVGKNLNFFQRLLFKPTVAKISYHTKIPFLVLHE